jgi:hypothetical protein
MQGRCNAGQIAREREKKKKQGRDVGGTWAARKDRMMLPHPRHRARKEPIKLTVFLQTQWTRSGPSESNTVPCFTRPLVYDLLTYYLPILITILERENTSLCVCVSCLGPEIVSLPGSPRPQPPHVTSTSPLLSPPASHSRTLTLRTPAGAT